MDTKKKEEALLMVIQVLKKACGDMDYIAQGLNSEQKDLLNTVNNSINESRNVVQDVLIQDKKDSLFLNNFQDEFRCFFDFISENGLVPKFIEHKSNYDE